MAHTHGRLLHRLTYICKTLAFRSDTLCTEQTWQHGHHLIRRQSTTWNLFARIDSNVNNRFTLLQKCLTTGDVIYKGLCFREPRLVALEEKSDSIERHAWLLVEPRIMGVDVEEQAIHAKGKVAIQ